MSRPKLQIQLDTFDKVVETIGWSIIAALWIIVLFVYSKLPVTIPTHFGISGKADGFGAKTTVFMLPAIATVLFILLTIANRFPHRFNYFKEITEKNAYRQYRIATKLLRMIKTAMAILFSALGVGTILTAFGETNGLPSAFLPITLFALFAIVVSSIIKASKAD